MKKILTGFKYIFFIIAYFLFFPLAVILYGKKTFLVSERNDEARDNGLSFYRYLINNQKDYRHYFVIDKHCSDYQKIKGLPNIVKYRSFKHFLLFVGAKYKCFSAIEGILPNHISILFIKRIHGYGKYVFLQHGVIKNDHPNLYKKQTNYDLFICGTYNEYLFIKDKFGYQDKEVIYTGLSRFDELYGKDSNKSNILILPTWRRYVDQNNFEGSEFFNKWNELINDKSFISLLEKNNLTCLFMMHPLFKNLSSSFKSNSSNIKVLSGDSDVSKLIQESSLLITDYSSVFFDFAYKHNPIIYYQFDESMFNKHYEKGYFDYRNDGFGKVCSIKEEAITELERIIKNNMNIDEIYQNRISSQFTLLDNKNNERIFNSIINKK